MTVLVVGGNGFVGSHVIDILEINKINSVVFDLKSNLARNGEFCTFIKGDLSNSALLEEIICSKKISHVIHLASTTLPKTSNENIKFDISSNVIDTIDLLDLCVKYKVKKILFMSSGGTVYGSANCLPVREDHQTNPICSYGISKLTIEKYLILYNHLHGLNFIVLRAANPYGPGQNPLIGQGVIANFIHKIRLGKSLEVWGDGNVVRDYFDVRDLALLTYKALFSDACGIFNAGSGLGLSINELIKVIATNLLVTPTVIYSEQRVLDVKSIILDCSKAKKVFNWSASIDIDSGICDYLKWYEKTFSFSKNGDL
jgi:UDP-glucose 4-epimerase